MIGQKYGRLTILEFSHYSGKHRKHFACQCECGRRKTVQYSLLRSGNTKSCGCLSTEIRRGRRLPNDAGVINHIILQYKRHAKGRGLEWDLSRDVAEQLLRGSCHYCGVAWSNVKRTKNHDGFRHNGIDRVSSDIGYIPDNVVSCCCICNRAKREMGYVEFTSWLTRVAAQWGSVVSEVAA